MGAWGEVVVAACEDSLSCSRHRTARNTQHNTTLMKINKELHNTAHTSHFSTNNPSSLPLPHTVKKKVMTLQFGEEKKSMVE